MNLRSGGDTIPPWQSRRALHVPADEGGMLSAPWVKPTAVLEGTWQGHPVRVDVTKGGGRLGLWGWSGFNTAGQAKGGIDSWPTHTLPFEMDSSPDLCQRSSRPHTHPPHLGQMALPKPLPQRRSGATTGSKGKLHKGWGAGKCMHCGGTVIGPEGRVPMLSWLEGSRAGGAGRQIRRTLASRSRVLNFPGQAVRSHGAAGEKVRPQQDITCVPAVTSVVSDSLWPHGLQPARLLCPWDSPGKNTGVGCHALLQGILPNPGIEPKSPASPALQEDFSRAEPWGSPREVLGSYFVLERDAVHWRNPWWYPRCRASGPGCSTEQEQPFLNQNWLQFAQVGSECMRTSRNGVRLSEITHDSSRLLSSEGILLKCGFWLWHPQWGLDSVGLGTLTLLMSLGDTPAPGWSYWEHRAKPQSQRRNTINGSFYYYDCFIIRR